MSSRKIIHVDMDAFYAAVEVLNNPSLKGKPLIVGGNPDSRSVVCSASYEARKFGIKSAMACSIAKRLCPEAVFLRPDFTKYRAVSKHIHEIFTRFTEKIESVALDEAWLDVTKNKKSMPSATLIAKEIKGLIRSELKLSCSAGVSFNKFLAKVASEEKKPDGLFVITPEEAPHFLNKMEIWKIPGVGKVTQRRLELLGIKAGHQLLSKSEGFLVDHFGKMGQRLFHIIRGIDHRPVSNDRKRKSISIENTFDKDLQYGEALIMEMEKLVDGLILRRKRTSLSGKTLTLKVKFNDFSQITRSISRNQPFSSRHDCLSFSQNLLKNVCNMEYSNKSIRLIGIGLSNFLSDSNKSTRFKQLDFFHLLPSLSIYK